MEIIQGREAVWQHAKEAGLQEDIKLISKYFDIKDVSIIFGGKMTYIIDKPRKTTRIAVAAKPTMTTADAIKEAKERRR